MAVSFAERLLCLFFPARCLSCEKIVPAGEALCASCAAGFSGRPEPQSFPLPGGKLFSVLAPLPYADGFRQSMLRFKFQGEKALAKQFARLMAEALPRPERFDAVVWTPLSRERRKERGYDQSELLAKEAARLLQLPCLPLLEKVRSTAVQHELPREERQKNVQGAYRAGPQAAGRSLLLVDDIVTTGATITECAAALYRAGASFAEGLCACCTPPPDGSGEHAEA